ncbi:hypothetical protein [Ascidiaceihabitans sp.]|uniref:hypothetical protein n=1 Tax=Ascidiaceihabitans sp. TaxID=1872644 RepID=UPI0032980F2F
MQSRLRKDGFFEGLKPVAVAMALMCASAVPAAAAGFLWDCKLSDYARSKGWIASTIGFVDDGSGAVQVVDPLILHYNKVALQGQVLRNDAKRLIVKWTLSGGEKEGGGTYGDFDYRASISKANGKIQLTAKPRQFDSGLRSGGRCTRRTK